MQGNNSADSSTLPKKSPLRQFFFSLSCCFKPNESSHEPSQVSIPLSHTSVAPSTTASPHTTPSKIKPEATSLSPSSHLPSGEKKKDEESDDEAEAKPSQAKNSQGSKESKDSSAPEISRKRYSGSVPSASKTSEVDDLAVNRRSYSVDIQEVIAHPSNTRSRSLGGMSIQRMLQTSGDKESTLTSSLQWLENSNQRGATKIRVRAQTAEDNRRKKEENRKTLKELRKIQKQSTLRQKKLSDHLFKHNSLKKSTLSKTELIESMDGDLIKNATIALNLGKDGGGPPLPLSLFMFMFHPITTTDIQSDEKLRDAYITALADRLVILALIQFKYFNAENPPSAFGVVGDIEQALDKTVTIFIKEHKKKILDTLRKATSTTGKAAEETPSLQAIIPSEGINAAIKQCVYFLSHNNILGFINDSVKKHLIDLVDAYIGSDILKHRNISPIA